MELNEFIQNFSSQFDETDPAVFNASTQFRNLDEWSSLIALSIISMIDEEYNISLDSDDLRKAITIEDLYNITKNK